ncbi:transcriptional regulator, TetR family [Eubacterium nodatum ATCC 33099]|nr:transcriptional regulator, TetR family [Eubacterium nodatum ATCC 33099]
MKHEKIKVAEKRKNEICEAAKRCFLAKGFSKTGMEDVIKEVGMSKGGVYHHYKSTVDMLYDIMLKGNDYRFNKVSDFIEKNPDMSLEEMAVELVIAKMFDENDFMSIYAMFLMECKENSRLRKLRDEMKSNLTLEFLDFLEKNNLEYLKPLTNDDFMKLMDSMYIAGEFIDVRDTFLNKSDLFRDIIYNYLQKNRTDRK